MTFIELNAFLGVCKLASTGGQAKQLIKSGVVTVNGAAETRNKRKLVAGDHVLVNQKTYVVKAEQCKMEK